MNNILMPHTDKHYSIQQYIDPAFTNNRWKEQQKNVGNFLHGKLGHIKQDLAQVVVKNKE